MTKERDVTDYITRLLGIDKDQFARICMIAQGDFLKLLLADTQDRKKILRNVFHTENYQKLQERLKAETSRARTEYEKLSHSCRSDGKRDPAALASYYRERGYDFFALTDHGVMEPSVEMLATYRDIPLGIKLFAGEEVHIPGGWIHIVNFGCSRSVNTLYRENKAKIDEMLEKEAEKLTSAYYEAIEKTKYYENEMKKYHDDFVKNFKRNTYTNNVSLISNNLFYMPKYVD
jgi:hypothetical protein